MSKVFEDKYNQKLLSLISDNGYNLTTTDDILIRAKSNLDSTSAASVADA